MIQKFSAVILLVISVSVISCGTTRRNTKSDKNTAGKAALLPPDATQYIIKKDTTANSPEAKVLVSTDGEDVKTVKLIEKGRASWYGPKFHGRLTANGEQYDMNGMTAAHRTLPFNTLVLVKNMDSGKSALVRINDRGPFAKNRIIDLSRQAARNIGMIGSGTARVKLYVEKKAVEESKSTHLAVPTYTVQLGSFKTEAQAFDHSGKIKGSRVEIVRKKNRTIYRVYYGLYINKHEAHKKQQELERKNFSGFVKQIENR